MAHSSARFTKFKATAPATWYQMKAITRLCTKQLGSEKYNVGLQINGNGLICRRKTTKTNRKNELLYDSKGCLLVRFGSETTNKINTQKKVSALEANNNYNSAVKRKAETKRIWMDAMQEKERMENKLHQSIKKQKQIIIELEQATSIHDTVKKRCDASELLYATKLEEEKQLKEILIHAEAHEKKVKKKKKKMKNKTKKTEIREKAKLAVEIANENVNSIVQELSNCHNLVEKNKEDLIESKTNKDNVQSSFENSVKERNNDTNDLRRAMKVVVQCSKDRLIANQVYDTCKRIHDTNESIILNITEDHTFCNWPSKNYSGVQLPNDYKNYIEWTNKDDFKLLVNNDKVVDIYFSCHCGQVWTKNEKIIIASCIGNVLGWEPIGGSCCTLVQSLMNEMSILDELEKEKERNEQKLIEERWKRAGIGL